MSAAPFSFPSRVRAGLGRESRGRIKSCESGISCYTVLYKTPKHRGGFSFASKPRKRALAPFIRDSLDLAEVESSPTAVRSSYSLSDRIKDAVDFAVSCSSSRCFSFLKRCSETRSQRTPASSARLATGGRPPPGSPWWPGDRPCPCEDQGPRLKHTPSPGKIVKEPLEFLLFNPPSFTYFKFTFPFSESVFWSAEI